MADFATLVLAADSRGLVAGEQALNSLASTAERTEGRTGKAMTSLAKSTEQVGRQSIFASQQSRMMAMQLSQVAQQASATGNWVQALAIQLPDMALGFGTLGIAAGVAAGAILPIIANMVMAGDEASDLADAIGNLKDATEDYENATTNASLSAGDLIQKFGQQALAAQDVYAVLRRLAELNFYESLRKQQEAVATSLGELTHSLEAIQGAMEFPGSMANQKLDEIRVQTENLAHTFGLTVGQANEIRDALNALGSADGPAAAAQAARDLSDAIDQAAEHGAKIPPEMRDAQRAALEAAEQALRFANLVGDAIPTTNSLADAMGGVADQAQRAAQFAEALTRRYPSQGTYGGVERSADGSIQGEDFSLPEVGPTITRRPLIELDGLGGSNRRSGGRSSAIKQAERERKAVADLIAELEEELSLVGKSEAEKRAAAAARSAGAAATEEERQKIISLTEAIYREEHAREQAQEQMEYYRDLTRSALDDVFSAVEDGKSVWEGLGDAAVESLKRIADSLIDDVLDSLFKVNDAAGSGGFNILDLLGFGSGSKSTDPWAGMRVTSFDGGGYTGKRSRSGGMDGKGGFMALLHPDETVIDHTKSSGATSASTEGRTVIEVRMSADVESRIMQNTARNTVEIVKQNNKNRQEAYTNGDNAYG